MTCCPNCDSPRVSSCYETEKFPYGVFPETVWLTAVIQKFDCAACGCFWSEENAEHERLLAVNKHMAKSA